MLPPCRPAGGPPLPASWRAALQCVAAQAEWMVWMDSLDRRTWRREAGERLHVAHVASASGALLHAPPAAEACGPNACLQPALVMPWSPARLWQPRQGRIAAGQQVGSRAVSQQVGSRATQAVRVVKGLQPINPALSLLLHPQLALAMSQGLALTRALGLGYRRRYRRRSRSTLPGGWLAGAPLTSTS